MGKIRINHKSHKNKNYQEELFYDINSEMDGTFAFIAGCTSGGAPYGVTWEEVGIDSELPFEEKVRIYMKQKSASTEDMAGDEECSKLFE